MEAEEYLPASLTFHHQHRRRRQGSVRELESYNLRIRRLLKFREGKILPSLPDVFPQFMLACLQGRGPHSLWNSLTNQHSSARKKAFAFSELRPGAL